MNWKDICVVSDFTSVKKIKLLLKKNSPNWNQIYFLDWKAAWDKQKIEGLKVLNLKNKNFNFK